MTSRIKPNSLDNNNNNNNNYGEKEKTESEVKVRILNPGTLIDKINCYHMTPTVISNISIYRVSQKNALSELCSTRSSLGSTAFFLEQGHRPETAAAGGSRF